jgi:predicted Zn-dependent protease
MTNFNETAGSQKKHHQHKKSHKKVHALAQTEQKTKISQEKINELKRIYDQTELEDAL